MTIRLLTTLAAIVLLFSSCSGGKSDVTAPSPLPETPSPFSTVATAGEPTDLDWAVLAGKLVGGAIDSLAHELTSSAGAFALRWASPLDHPVAPRTAGSAHLERLLLVLR